MNEKLEAGLNLLESGDIEAATAIFQEMLTNNPQSADGDYGLGLIAQLEGSLGISKIYFEKVALARPDWPPVLYSLAMLEFEAGDSVGARTKLLKVLELEPENLGARRLLAQILIDSGHFDEGVQLLVSILSSNPDDWETHFLLATLYAEIDQQPHVCQHLEAVLAINPDHVEAQQMLAQWAIGKA